MAIVIFANSLWCCVLSDLIYSHPQEDALYTAYHTINIDREVQMVLISQVYIRSFVHIDTVVIGCEHMTSSKYHSMRYRV